MAYFSRRSNTGMPPERFQRAFTENGDAVASNDILLIIQAGHAPDDIRAVHGDISVWYERVLEGVGLRTRVVRPFLGESLPDPGSVCAAVITGSWAMVSERADWSERTAAWVREAMEVSLPLLGVCFGHQLMAHALGGHVDYHPEGLEIGVRRIEVGAPGRTDPFFQHWPAAFDAPLTHLQSVLRLPETAVSLAGSAHDPNQIVRYGPHAISVQFHPEFDEALLTACIGRIRDRLTQDGMDVVALLDAVTETADARRVLLDFASRACRRGTEPPAVS